MTTHDLRDIPIARSLWQRTIGLIGRTDPARLFLFIPRCTVVHTWFMSAPIDLVFLDDRQVVLAVAPEARPWRIHAGSKGTRSVLELPAGYAGRAAIAIGDAILLGPHRTGIHREAAVGG